MIDSFFDSCVASIGSTFAFEVEDKQDDHGNSRNGSKVVR
jgi:hypothetical protein